MIIALALLLLFLALVNMSIILFNQVGRKPKGIHLEAILKADNYTNDQFQNPVETDMSMPFNAFFEMMKRSPDQSPDHVVKTLVLDKDRFCNANKSETLVCWLGHSSFLLKTNGKTLLFDPVFSTRASMFKFLGPKKFIYSNEYTLDDLPSIDAVFISHDHYDHLDKNTIQKLSKTVNYFYTPLGIGAHLAHFGIVKKKVIELNWWETIEFQGMEITATPGRHFSGRFFNDRFKTLWCGWVIKSGSSNVYFTGDSGYFEGFKEIGNKLGPFNFALMECGQYGKYWPNIHMFPEQSVQAAIDAKVNVAMPIHWGKFKLSNHGWLESPERFLKEADKKGLVVSTPQIGEIFSISDVVETRWWQN